VEQHTRQWAQGSENRSPISSSPLPEGKRGLARRRERPEKLDGAFRWPAGRIFAAPEAPRASRRPDVVENGALDPAGRTVIRKTRARA
jgi:hypothetical protein